MDRLTVLIAPDKFKGSLEAEAVARAIAAGWRAARPTDTLIECPVSDGGDGFGRLIADRRGGKRMVTPVSNAAGERISASWWWEASDQVAIVEAAQANGLAQLPRGRFHPFHLSTFGVGELILEAIRHHPRRLLIGVGGSATNDAGFGLARALGWRFLDATDTPIESWTRLTSLRRLLEPAPSPKPSGLSIEVAVDVQNPLLGKNGCSAIYGPQKGLKADEIPAADAALSQLAMVVESTLGGGLATVPGAGAAGGLAYGFAAFAGASIHPGFAQFAALTGFDAALAQADLVVTGEGQIDESTWMGKAAGEVASQAAARRIPCLAVAGQARRSMTTPRFRAIQSLAPEMTSVEEAIQHPSLWVERAAAALARRLDGLECGPIPMLDRIGE